MAKRRKRTNKNVPAKGRLCKFADDLWSLWIRDDWAQRCAVCGRTSNLNAHHLIHRHHYAVRYLSENGICLCGYCHVRCPKYSPHLNGLGFRAWLNEHHPMRAAWCDVTIENGLHFRFDRIKNAHYSIEQILALKHCVDDDEFIRVVGVRFAAWLEEHE